MINVRYLWELTCRYGVTHFDMVPSLYKEYLRVANENSSLCFVLLAWEPLSYKVVKKHFSKLSKVRLVNE